MPIISSLSRWLGWVHYDRFSTGFIMRVTASLSEGAGCRGFLCRFCLFVFCKGNIAGLKRVVKRSVTKRFCPSLTAGFLEWKIMRHKKGLLWWFGKIAERKRSNFVLFENNRPLPPSGVSRKGVCDWSDHRERKEQIPRGGRAGLGSDGGRGQEGKMYRFGIRRKKVGLLLLPFGRSPNRRRRSFWLGFIRR